MYGPGNGCGCGCGGDCGHLTGVGLVDTSQQTTTTKPWWETVITDISKVFTKTPTVPTYPTTLPGYPPSGTTYPTYPQPYYEETQPATNWTPWLIGGAVLLAVMASRK